MTTGRSIPPATMVDSPALKFPRSLPCAPNIDISQIKGNVTDEEKQLEVNVLFYFISTQKKSYGADIGQRLKIVEINVWNKDGAAAYGETIFEIEVQKGQLSIQFCFYHYGPSFRYVQRIRNIARRVRSIYGRPVRIVLLSRKVLDIIPFFQLLRFVTCCTWYCYRRRRDWGFAIHEFDLASVSSFVCLLLPTLVCLSNSRYKEEINYALWPRPCSSMDTFVRLDVR